MMANHRLLALTPCTLQCTSRQQLLGQPITNQNTFFVFKFSISINELRLKFWQVQNDQGATTKGHCIYVYNVLLCTMYYTHYVHVDVDVDGIRALCACALEFG